MDFGRCVGWEDVDWLKSVYRSINQLVCQIYMSVKFDTDQCVCRLNLVSGRMSEYRSINQFVRYVCRLSLTRKVWNLVDRG